MQTSKTWRLKNFGSIGESFYRVSTAARFLTAAGLMTSRLKNFKVWAPVFGFGGSVAKVFIGLPTAVLLAATALKSRSNIENFSADFKDFEAKNFQILSSVFQIW